MFLFYAFLRYISTGLSVAIVKTSPSGSAGSGSASQLTKEKDNDSHLERPLVDETFDCHLEYESP